MLQNTNLQMSQLKLDLRVTQQEKETLKQEVVSLHQQLQNASAKVTALGHRRVRRFARWGLWLRES